MCDLSRWSAMANWRFFYIFLIPVLLSPLLFLEDTMEINGTMQESKKFRCLYVMLMMAFYWMAEALPIPITGLLPVVFLPLFGVVSTSGVSANYMNAGIMMVLGGFIMAFALESNNIHKRIALFFMLKIGSSPIRMLTSIMVATFFISMWLETVATVALMVPVVMAVLEGVENNNIPDRNLSVSSLNSNNTSQLEAVYSSEPHLTAAQISSRESLCKESMNRVTSIRNQKLMYLFSILYTSVLGGLSVLTGAVPNLIAVQHLKKADLNHAKYLDLTFATWIAYNFPIMMLNAFIAWIYLIFKFLGCPDWMAFWREGKPREEKLNDKQREEELQVMLKNKYNSLGPLTFPEIAVDSLLLMAVLLWFFRDPKFIPGWGQFVDEVNVGDATVAVLICFLFFVIPKDPGFLFGKKSTTRETLLDWQFVQSRFPIGIFLLIGGGFAISNASDRSRLTEWLGQQLSQLNSLDRPVILIIVMIAATFITEMLSNAACINVIVPILMNLSRNLGFHPYYLALPTAVSCNFAFMFPSSSPISAIVYAAGGKDMRIIDMVQTGVFVNFFCIAVLCVLHMTYGNLIFDFDNFVYENGTADTSRSF